MNVLNGLAKDPVKSIPITAQSNTYAYDWQSAALTDADVNLALQELEHESS